LIPGRKEIEETNRRVSRPEDPDTQRLRRNARLLRAVMLPEAAGVMVEAQDLVEDSETEAALRRATAERNGTSRK
jgi:hypothetical protein